MLGDDDGRAFEAEGRGPAVLALHGFTGTVSELRPLVSDAPEAAFLISPEPKKPAAKRKTKKATAARKKK